MPLTDAQKQTISEQWDTLTPERQEKAQRLGVTPPAPAISPQMATPTPEPPGGQAVPAPGGAPAPAPQTWKVSMTDPQRPEAATPERLRIPPNLDADLTK